VAERKVLRASSIRVDCQERVSSRMGRRGLIGALMKKLASAGEYPFSKFRGC
jgi:hypothetical protein